MLKKGQVSEANQLILEASERSERARYKNKR